MGMDNKQSKQLESIEQRSRRLKAAVDEWVSLIDETRESMPERPKSELATTLRMPPNGSNRSH